MDTALIQHLLQQCWSQETSTLWSADNPARGQCDVTALVIHAHYGGHLLKTFIEEQPHFYNQINGIRYDFTASQFPVLPEYEDLSAEREEILTSSALVRQQYQTLRERFEQLLGQGKPVT